MSPSATALILGCLLALTAVDGEASDNDGPEGTEAGMFNSHSTRCFVGTLAVPLIIRLMRSN